MFRVVLFLGLLLPAHFRGVASVVTQQHEPSRFRYVIVTNQLDSPNTFRNLTVLMEEKAFNEASLTELFRLLKTRFPHPQALFVEVRVSLEDLPTPEEADEPRASDGPDKGSSTHPQATLVRGGLGSEWFSYVMNPTTGVTKTVVLKGKPGQRP